jgi:hypothetical protein
MNDHYVRDEKLTELPITFIIPNFRSVGESIARRDEIDPENPLMRHAEPLE